MMGGGGPLMALQFILEAVAGFFSVLFLLRFIMQARRASFANQLGGFVMQLTDWAVKPLRRIIPGIGGYDWSSLVAAYLVQLLLLVLIVSVAGGLAAMTPDVWLLLLGKALLGLVRQVVYLFMFALIIAAVLSWVNPYSPLAGPINQLTRPILAPIQRILPPISGIDLSPLVAILLLQVVLMFL